MSETSRSRVTITLGRTGQVVKRGGGALDNSLTDSYPVVGSKRSVRERLGNNVDSFPQVGNKRVRGDGRTINDIDDVHLGKNDLRYKIMQKNILKQSGGDLRNILSRPSQSSMNNAITRERLPEPKDSRLPYLETINGSRQHFTDARDDNRHSLSMSRNSSQHIPEFRAQQIPDSRKQSILEDREGGRSSLEQRDVRRSIPEPRNSRMMADLLPGMRAPRMESGVSSYSPWNLDSLRKRPSDEALATSRGVLAPKRDEELQRKFAVRTYDDARPSTYMSKDASELSRPVSSSHLAKMAPPVGLMKTMAPMVSSLPQKSSYVVDDQISVDSFLRSLELEKYAILFKAEEIDMYSLKRMVERDLKELGIPMGPRKKILLSLQPRLKQQQA